MIYFLSVVTVGGSSGIMGPFVASLLLGVADVAGKFFLSSALGGFVIYVVLIVVLWLRPNGLFSRWPLTRKARLGGLPAGGRRDTILCRHSPPILSTPDTSRRTCI